MMRWLKQIFRAIVVLMILGGIVCAFLFTTCEVSGKRALVAKCYRKESLQPGDMLQVNPDIWNTKDLVVCRLEKINPPDERDRIRARGRGSGIAQAIVDMDFKPTYSVTLLSNETNNAAMTINQRQIRGKIIKVY
jgi:hypothetical protein